MPPLLSFVISKVANSLFHAGKPCAASSFCPPVLAQLADSTNTKCKSLIIKDARVKAYEKGVDSSAMAEPMQYRLGVEGSTLAHKVHGGQGWNVPKLKGLQG